MTFFDTAEVHGPYTKDLIQAGAERLEGKSADWMEKVSDEQYEQNRK